MDNKEGMLWRLPMSLLALLHHWNSQRPSKTLGGRGRRESWKQRLALSHWEPWPGMETTLEMSSKSWISRRKLILKSVIKSFKCYLFTYRSLSHTSTKYWPLQPGVRFCPSKEILYQIKGTTPVSQTAFIHQQDSPKWLIHKGTINALLAGQCVCSGRHRVDRGDKDHLTKVPRYLYTDKIV